MGNSPTNCKESLAFASLAAEYCALIDQRCELSAPQLCQQSQHLLPRLYVAALELPEIWPERDVEEENMDPDRWQRLHNELATLLREHDLYWEVFSPYNQKDHEPVCGSLADDLADIYRDLWVGLNLWNQGTPLARAAASWEWRFSFFSHWGQHVTSALRAFHALHANNE